MIGSGCEIGLKIGFGSLGRFVGLIAGMNFPLGSN